MEKLTQALVLFQRVGMPARNLSARTRIEYSNDLGDFIAFLEGRGVTKLASVGLPEMESYQAEMDSRGYRPSSRRRKTYAIKTFFTFLHRQGITRTNLADRLIPPPPVGKEPRFLSENEYKQLLRVCSHNTRDAAIIELLLQTGMRLSELARLKLTDIELPKRPSREPDGMGTVYITRKGGRTDSIPLNYKACQAVAAYLKTRPNVGHDTLFTNKA